MNILDTLNGSVYSQGIKIDARDWLDMGSEGWRATTDKQKAAAYQAAKVTGWTDKGLYEIMIKQFGPRIDEFQADLTLGLLRDYEKEYPIEQEVLDTKDHKDVWKVTGSETAFPFPKTEDKR